MDRYLLGIDVGTSGMKVIVSNAVDFRTIARASKCYRPRHPKPDWAELPAETIWSSLLECVKAVSLEVELSRIVGIGVSCLCPGLVAIAPNGEILYGPILHNDRRSGDESRWFTSVVGEQSFRMTGNHVMPGAISVTSILWLRENFPEVFQKARWFGHINTMLSVMLTGRAAIDPTNASYTGLYNTREESGWIEEFCISSGIDIKKLPPILEPTEVSGTLNAAQLIGLGIPSGTPVTIGAADTACAALASGVDLKQDVFENIGSTGVVSLCTDQPHFTKKFLNRRYVTKGTWLYQGASSNIGLAITWAERQLCRDSNCQNGQFLDRVASQSPAGANGCVFLPYLSGERCPIWDENARGVYFGLRLETTRDDMARATLESGCYSTKQMIEIAENLTQKRYPAVHVAGGGAKSNIWMQLHADILDREIHVLDLPDASATGAAILASVGIGIYPDLDTASSVLQPKVKEVFLPQATATQQHIYQCQYQTFLQLYADLKHRFAASAEMWKAQDIPDETRKHTCKARC